MSFSLITTSSALFMRSASMTEPDPAAAALATALSTSGLSNSAGRWVNARRLGAHAPAWLMTRSAAAKSSCSDGR